MVYERRNQGVCSRSTKVDIEDGVIKEISIVGGCNGNLNGISKLLVGMKAEDAITRMEGVTCGPRKTSCPDQIAVTLKEALAQQS
jgi:uncharacterized protein TIGR03905